MSGIYLYDPHAGTTLLTPLPTDSSYVATQINSSGKVVWSAYQGSDLEIFLYDPVAGITQLTNDGNEDSNPQINNSGQVVWTNYEGTCDIVGVAAT